MKKKYNYYSFIIKNESTLDTIIKITKNTKLSCDNISESLESHKNAFNAENRINMLVYDIGSKYFFFESHKIPYEKTNDELLKEMDFSEFFKMVDFGIKYDNLEFTT